MANYDYENPTVRQSKDLVLAPNEFCFIQNKTSGAIKTYTGPTTSTISQRNLWLSLILNLNSSAKYLILTKLNSSLCLLQRIGMLS